MRQFFPGSKLLPVIVLVVLVEIVTALPGMPTNPKFMTATPGEAMDIEGHRVFVFDKIQKSDQDKCSYRYLTLENGLQALLVSEPGLDKASAALDVHVGNFYDPKDIPGLAHFLEHLLFMGTEKYPNENEYGQYLASHGGHSNAFTAEEHTNYFFEVSADSLGGALDRFAQFFIAPLFNPSGTERELLAVDSEHKKNVKNDHWRLNQLEKTLSNPNHPYSHFGTGSSVTLGENTAAHGLDIRSILIEFYEKHYSSNLMKLVVYGKESLDELQRMVVPKFVKVVNRNFALQEWNDLPLDERHFGKLIRMRTIKDMQTLYIIWQLPDMQKYRQEKPDHYYSHLLGHEGHGSILSLLKAKGWATALSAGSDNDSRGYSFFQVSVELTPDGLSHVEEIIKTVFQYLQMLRLEGPQHWIYEESRRLEEIAFRFAENGSPSIFAHNTARNMQSYPPKMVLKGPRVTTAYDFQLLTNMLEHLGATNFRALLATNEELPSEKVQYEPWYRTEYTIEPLRDSLIKAIATHSEEPFLHLPHPNKYLPDALEIKSPTATEPVMHPELSVDQGQYRLWHKQDDIFEQPKACFKFVVHNNVTYSSATNLVRSTLFLDLLQDSLSELLYEAHVAGLRFDVELEARGLVFAFYGYDDKLPLLLREVMQRVVQFQADPARFAAIHDRYSRWLKSFVHDMPYSLVTYYLNGVQKEHYWWYWQKAAVLPSITIGDVNSVVGEIFAAANIEALCHGNYRAEEAVTILAVLQGVLKNTAPLPDPDNVHVIALKPRQDLIYAPPPVPNASSAISMYLQIGSLGDLRLRALTELFVQLFQEPFFDLLRTKEQLGYIVRHQIRKKDNSVGLEFLIQSEHDPIYLDERIESFLAQTISSLSDMGDEEFNEHVQSLINKLLAKKRKLTDETYIYWHHVYIQQYEFERRFVDAEYLRRLTKADLLFFIRQYVLPGGSERKKLAVHLWSDSKDEERRAAYEKLPKDVQLFEKPEGLAKVVGQFPLVYSIKDLGSQL